MLKMQAACGDGPLRHCEFGHDGISKFYFVSADLPWQTPGESPNDAEGVGVSGSKLDSGSLGFPRIVLQSPRETPNNAGFTAVGFGSIVFSPFQPALLCLPLRLLRLAA